MRSLLFAAASGLLATFVSNIFFGLIVAAVVYIIFRLPRAKRTDDADFGSSSTNSPTVDASQQDSFLGNGGLFAGAGASAGWDAVADSASESGGGDGGGGDSGGGD